MKTLNYLVLPFILLTFASCMETKSKRTKNVVNTDQLGNSNQNPIITNPTQNTGGSGETSTPADPGTGGAGQGFGTGNEPGVSDAGQTIEYYKLNNPPAVLHGTNDGIVAWSSETDLPSGFSADAFISDSRFNLRVIPRRQAFGTDSKGNSCNFNPQPYQKLQIGVRVKKQGNTSGDYFLFSEVPVDQASKVHEFNVPENNNGPVIVEILNVKWEWSCQFYANQGFPNVPGYCPYATVWSTECVGVEVQFATDGTKNIPGTRTN